MIKAKKFKRRRLEPKEKPQKKTIQGLECLNCKLPVSVCCGIPSHCQARYARYLEKQGAKK